MGCSTRPHRLGELAPALGPGTFEASDCTSSVSFCWWERRPWQLTESRHVRLKTCRKTARIRSVFTLSCRSSFNSLYRCLLKLRAEPLWVHATIESCGSALIELEAAGYDTDAMHHICVTLRRNYARM
jgi:hypothetical protein